jgi:hypothetical protein
VRCTLLTLIAAAAPLFSQAPVRFKTNPLISVNSPKSIGDNVNGPSIIRVPQWIEHPLGRYYMYFGHHKGTYIRMAYADKLTGPWKVYEPGVLDVKDTIFSRPPIESPEKSPNLYTHVASPDVVIDEANHRLVMYVHGMWTEGKAAPSDPAVAAKWFTDNKYAQYTQTTVSRNGIHFDPKPGVVLRTSYLREFQWNDGIYGMARLGVLSRAKNIEGPFEEGPNPFDGSQYADRVRHVALLVKENTLYIFFSAIGDAPERIRLSTIALTPDWTKWKASTPIDVLTPSEKYECVQLPVVKSRIGEVFEQERSLRDPALFEENGKVYLFYSVCGEQGIGGADVTAFVASR